MRHLLNADDLPGSGKLPMHARACAWAWVGQQRSGCDGEAEKVVGHGQQAQESALEAGSVLSLSPAPFRPCGLASRPRLRLFLQIGGRRSSVRFL